MAKRGIRLAFAAATADDETARHNGHTVFAFPTCHQVAPASSHASGSYRPIVKNHRRVQICDLPPALHRGLAIKAQQEQCTLYVTKGCR